MPFHTDYRPPTLSKIIGNEEAVATLRRYAETGKVPSAIMFVGPPSSGKTTMARAGAREVLGSEEAMNSSFEETSLSENRSIEEVRGLIRLASMRPMTGKRRFILCDEAQGILANAPAAHAFLKPLEEPIPTTTWMLSTMEPEKFMASTVGRAIASRCVKIKLRSPTDEELTKFAIRIRKGEGINLTPEQTKSVAAACATFRDVANTMELLAGADDLERALDSVLLEETDEQIKWKDGLTLGLLGNYRGCCMSLMGTKNGVGLVQTAGYMAWGLLVLEVSDGTAPKGVWGAGRFVNEWKRLRKSIKEPNARLQLIADFNDRVTQLKISSGAFAVAEDQSICALMRAYAK